MPIVFNVPGDPVSQPRPRVTTRGGFARAYTPAGHAVHVYREAIALAAKAAGAGVHGDPVEVVIDAVWKRPQRPTSQLPRQDVDNVAKAVLDALTGVAWEDDRQVRRLVIEKSYGPEGRTTVRIA